MITYGARDSMSVLIATMRFAEVKTIHLSENRWPRHFCTTCVDCRKDALDRAAVKAELFFCKSLVGCAALG